MAKQYEALARVYDKLMYDVRYADWGNYLAQLLANNGVYGGSLLEYACGTGNITLELLQAGYDTIAVDISEEMLDIAREKLRKKAHSPRLLCADMIGFRLNKLVAAAVCACDGVNYVLEAVDLGLFFTSVYANLVPGGVFLFDISSAHKLSTILGNEFFYDDGEEQTLFWQNRYDGDKQTIEMDITLFIKEGDIYRRLDERHMQRAWEIEEVKETLENAGFADIRVYAFLSTEKAKKDTERVQFVARKGSL